MDQKIKVSFINRRPGEGHFSLEGYFARISEALIRAGVDVNSHTSPCSSKGVWNRLRIVAFAAHNQADINHITGDIHFAACGTEPSRTIVTVADCGRLHQLSGVKREVMRQLWFQIPLTRVAVVTVISHAVKDDLLSWVPNLDPDRIHVVPVSISPDFAFTPRPFNRDHPRILQVGTSPNKNIPRLAKALRGLAVSLDIIGRLTPEITRVLEDCGVCYRNFCNISDAEVVDLYRNADFLAFASTLEGFGMPILEAQSVGRPVLTSNCSSMPEVAGEAAVFVDPYSVESIRAGLLRIIDDADYRDRLIQKGRLNVRRYSTEAIASDYLRIYNSISHGVG